MRQPLLPAEETTRQAYNQHALAWQSVHNTPGFWGREMHRFRELLADGHVLEVGAGAGRDAAELIDLGYGYTGIDISPGMLVLARQRLAGADFREMSVYDLAPAAAWFDGFWAACSLLHVPKSRMNEALTAIRDTVRDGAIGFIALKQGCGEGLSDSDVPGMTRFFAWWQKQEFAAVLDRSEFAVADYWRAGSRHCFFVRAV